MQDAELTVLEMERCKKETDLVGFEIGTTINDFNLNDKCFDQVWSKAAELDFCFFIHPWDMQRYDSYGVIIYDSFIKRWLS